MSKHTPGLWEMTETLGQLAITIPHNTIGIAFNTVCHINSDICKGDSEANARLIAAAPELLEACKAIMDARDNRKIKVDGKEYKALLLADQAIAKAEGGSNA